MPLYEFRCENCGMVVEELLRHADMTAQVTCPACGTLSATRLLSAPAIGGSESAAGGGCGGSGSGFT